jgi:porin
MLGDRLDVEIGRSNAVRYYGLPQCQSLDSCFQDILYYNAGFLSPQYSVYGANASYKVTPEIYVQAGAFGDNGNPRVGYNINEEVYKGVLGVGEVGRKTSFASDLYPSSVALTGLFNSSPHVDLNRFSPLTPSPSIGTQNVYGTSGALLQGQKIIWRADGGRNADNPNPTALNLYASVGSGFDSTTPVLVHMWAGATLQSPFDGRPGDRFGVKFSYERLNSDYSQYLAAANFVSGGTGAPFNPNKYVLEANAHIQLPAGLAFEPVFQYAINLNSFYNPLTAARPRDGIYAAGVLIIPVGALLGLSPS